MLAYLVTKAPDGAWGIQEKHLGSTPSQCASTIKTIFSPHEENISECFLTEDIMVFDSVGFLSISGVDASCKTLTGTKEFLCSPILIVKGNVSGISGMTKDDLDIALSKLSLKGGIK